MTEVNNNVVKPFEPHFESIDGRPVFIKDANGAYEDFEKFLKTPTRIRMSEKVRVFDSFIEILNTRVDKDKAAVYTQAEINTKFDDFGFVAYANDCRNDNPAWRKDVTFAWEDGFMKRARDWLLNDEKVMSQDDFALFLDKHIDDIRCVTPEVASGYPTQMELFNFVSTLQESKSDRFTRKVNIQNGDVTVCLERESDDGTKKQLKLFERFPIVLQLYEGFPTYQVTAKLRFRTREGHVLFQYDIEGLEEMFIAARDWAANQIREKTGLPVYI